MLRNVWPQLVGIRTSDLAANTSKLSRAVSYLSRYEVVECHPDSFVSRRDLDIYRSSSGDGLSDAEDIRSFQDAPLDRPNHIAYLPASGTEAECDRAPGHAG